MCPACIASMALTVAGVTSAGGLTVFVAKKVRPKGTAVRAKGTAKEIVEDPNQKRSSS